MKNIVGLIVNPVAGMGGSVGLKGTDGETYKKALELGAQPVTSRRTKDCLSRIENKDGLYRPKRQRLAHPHQTFVSSQYSGALLT